MTLTPQELASDFGEWWALCPRKVAKLYAEKVYGRVRRTGVTREALLDGMERYMITKPPYADWCHPATWLNQGRWLDEPDNLPAQPCDRSLVAAWARPEAMWECPHTPRCPHRAACAVVSRRAG